MLTKEEEFPLTLSITEMGVILSTFEILNPKESSSVYAMAFSILTKSVKDKLEAILDKEKNKNNTTNEPVKSTSDLSSLN